MVCADSADRYHERAVQAQERWLQDEGLLVTTDYVIAETLTLLRFRLGLDVAQQWWQNLASSRRTQRELIDDQRAERAREIFFRYRDKDFSFTDCTSFALMRELRVRVALTTDRHFRQAGFDILPRA
jgi:uncharacterized protein